MNRTGLEADMDRKWTGCRPEVILKYFTSIREISESIKSIESDKTIVNRFINGERCSKSTQIFNDIVLDMRSRCSYNHEQTNSCRHQFIIIVPIGKRLLNDAKNFTGTTLNRKYKECVRYEMVLKNA